MTLIEMALDANALRREVIADNIANVNVPFFKRSEVSFESQLTRALESEQQDQFPTMMTDERHISFNQFIDYKGVSPKISVEYDSNYRNDKNNVDIDKEMIDSTKNSMQYNALMEMYSRNLKIVDFVMR
ncbi:MAG: flagellar basal-body rod protein FlgB [Spirochaetes bacterium GWF1_51_8]|nr:MAG: flagellar basal-body rod protein FlgB [Spirochaetes bacterium GWF1_51_8]